MTPEEQTPSCPEADHCWHSTGAWVASLPPWEVRRCCWCGIRLEVRVESGIKSDSVHGPYKGVMR